MFVGDLFTIQSFLQSKTTIVFHLLQGTFMPPKNRELLNQNDFISTLGYPQTLLASHQWKKIESIFNACNKNYIKIINILKKYGFVTLSIQNTHVFSVSSRVPFLINEREKAIDWFEDKGLELGKWFDGPLSPVPKKSIFKFDPKLYYQSSKLSNHIVNLPCNNKINEKDIKKFDFLMGEYLKLYPDSILKL